MLLRLAEGDRGQAGTKCESFCADALAGFIRMLDRKTVEAPQLIDLCLRWLANDVGNVIMAFIKAPVQERIALIHSLAARVGALSQTPMRTLLAAPGQSLSGFSRTTQPLLHTMVTAETGFATLLMESMGKNTFSQIQDDEYTKRILSIDEVASLVTENQSMNREIQALKDSVEGLEAIVTARATDMMT